MAAHPGAGLLAGGTDLLVQTARRPQGDGSRRRCEAHPRVECHRLRSRRRSDAGSRRALLSHLYRIRDVARTYPSLAEVPSLIGGTQIQGRASIGGNLCNAAPSADSVPLLIALRRHLPDRRARAAIARWPWKIFALRPAATCCNPANCWCRCTCRRPAPNSGAQYLRFIPRNEMDIAVAGVGRRSDHWKTESSARRGSRWPPSHRRRSSCARPAMRWPGSPVDAASIAAAAEIARGAPSPSRTCAARPNTAAICARF